MPINGGTGGPHGPRSPTFISEGAWHPTFFLNIISLSNRISTGASDKVNRLIKKTLQSFRCILSILFLIYSIICNLEVKLSGFHNCLAEYTVRSLSHCYGLLTALRLLNSVARS